VKYQRGCLGILLILLIIIPIAGKIAESSDDWSGVLLAWVALVIGIIIVFNFTWAKNIKHIEERDKKRDRAVSELASRVALDPSLGNNPAELIRQAGVWPLATWAAMHLGFRKLPSDALLYCSSCGRRVQAKNFAISPDPTIVLTCPSCKAILPMSSVWIIPPKRE
jgi:hypothetical protein